MRSRLLVFLGNCQADMLARVYERHIAPLMGDEVIYVDSQNVTTKSEDGLRALAAADHVVTQQFDFPTKVTADQLGVGVKQTSFPQTVVGFLWPFYGQAHSRNRAEPFLPSGPYAAQIGDRFLNGLLAKGVSPGDALSRYMDLDVNKRVNLDRLYELWQERQKGRDEKTGYEINKEIEKYFRSESLSLTPDHPELRLFGALARRCYFELDVPEVLTERALERLFVAPFPTDQLPIHPGVAEHFGLSYADASTRYNHLDEGKFTFAEYVLRYMDYEYNPALQEGWSGEVPPRRALQALEDGLATSPGSFRGWVAKSRVLLDLNQAEAAKDAAQTALGLEPDNPAAGTALARAHLASGELAQAEAAARRAIASFRNDAQAHWVLAEVLFACGRRDEAMATQQEGIDLLPGDASGHASMGRLRMRNGEFREAERSLRRALQLRPGDADAAASRIECLARIGRLDEAVNLLRQGMESGAAGPHDHARLGNLLMQADDLAGAERAFRQAIMLESKVESFHDGLAAVLERQGRLGEALETVRASDVGGSSGARTKIRLGRLLSRAGDVEGAEAVFRQAVALDAGMTDGRNELAAVLERRGQVGEATRLTRALLGERPRDAHAHARLGRLLRRSGDLAGSETAFRQAIALDGSVAGFHHELADVLAEQDRIDEAVAAARAAVQANPPVAHAHARLATLLARSGEVAAAEQALRMAVELEPEEDAFRSALAGLLDGQGRAEEASGLRAARAA